MIFFYLTILFFLKIDWQNLSAAELIGGITVIGGALVGISKFFEDVFGVKGPATIVIKFLWRWLVSKPLAFCFHPIKKIIDTGHRVEIALGTLQASGAQRDLTLENLAVKVEEISHQVHFNSGSSLKDAVIRVEESNKSLTILVKRIARQALNSYEMDSTMSFTVDAQLNCNPPPPNKRYMETFNLQESDVIDQNWMAGEHIHPDDMPIVLRKWQFSREKKIRYDNIQRLLVKGGGYLKCRVRAEPILDDDDNFYGFSGKVDLLPVQG